MKTKAKKRLEAIQRLERNTADLSDRRGIPQGDGTVILETIQDIVARRHMEAARLREAFKL